MPTISSFYGIVIKMYLRDKEHNPPHVHAEYGNKGASFYISSGEICEGEFPYRARKLVKEFILKYQKELLWMRESGEYYKLKGLDWYVYSCNRS